MKTSNARENLKALNKNKGTWKRHIRHMKNHAKYVKKEKGEKVIGM